MTLVSIIVPTWNGLPLLKKCMNGLTTQTYRDFEIVVVDDGSNDGTSAWLESRRSKIRPLILPINRGFAAAMNAGIAVTTGEYLIALNNDTVPDPGFVEHMVSSAQTGYDMVAGRVVLDGHNVIDSAGISVLRDGCSKERLRGVPEESIQALHQTEVFGPSAAASLYSRRMLNRIGLFDESFEAFYEDVDLAWRARIGGFRCLYNPRATVRHVHSASYGKLSIRKLFLLERNRYWILWRHYPVRAWPLSVAYHACEAASLFGSGYLDGNTQEKFKGLGVNTLARIEARAAIGAWRRFPAIMAERQKLTRTMRVSKDEISRWLYSHGL